MEEKFFWARILVWAVFTGTLRYFAVDIIDIPTFIVGLICALISWKVSGLYISFVKWLEPLAG